MSTMTGVLTCRFIVVHATGIVGGFLSCTTGTRHVHNDGSADLSVYCCACYRYSWRVFCHVPPGHVMSIMTGVLTCRFIVVHATGIVGGFLSCTTGTRHVHNDESADLSVYCCACYRYSWRVFVMYHRGTSCPQ